MCLPAWRPHAARTAVLLVAAPAIGSTKNAPFAFAPQSEALFVDQQAQIENRKLEAAALAEVQKMELEAQAKRKKAATERLQKLEAGVEEEMLEWLERHRLSRHADAIAKAAGRDAAPADLLYLTEEDVAEIGALLLAPTALALTG